MAGVGIIIRDHFGSVLECATLIKLAAQSVPLLETIAIFEGLIMARNMGASHIMVECDSELVINSINRGIEIFSVLGHFVNSISELAVVFTSCSFSFRNRLGNQVAHVLARSCLSASNSRHWLFSFPEFISDVLHRDVEHCNSCHNE